MEVRCMMCGKKEKLGQDHVEYNKFNENPKATYICTFCKAKTFNEAKEGQNPKKPM